MFKISKDFRHQAFAVFPVFVANILFGCGFGWVSPSIAYFKSEECPFPVDNDELTWIASAFFVSKILASIVAGLFADKMGRKSLIIVALFTQTLSWFLMTIANSVNVVLVSRVLLGSAAGIHDTSWSIYVGELASPDKRGTFNSVLVSGFIAGIMFEFLISSFLPYSCIATVPFAISVIDFVLMFFAVETPQYLLTTSKDDAAMKTLAWLRGRDDPESVKNEYREMKEYIEEQMKSAEHRPGAKDIYKSPSEYKLCAVAILIFLLIHPSGNIVILSYQTIIFDSFANLPNGKKLTLIFGVLQYVAIIFSTFIIEKAGRRVFLISGFAVSAIVQTANTGLLYIAQKNNFAVEYIPQILLVLFNIYGVVFMICLCPTAYILKSELFPQKLKTIGNVISTLTNAAAEFIVVKPFVFLWDTYGLHVNFAICAVVSVIGIIYTFVLIPETKGKSLVEIQRENKSTKVGRELCTVRN